MRRAVRLVGPALIVLGPAIVLHDFWLGSRLSTQQVDLLPFWLPRWCFLGRTLAAGHIPTWLPYQFGGVPFASDPQSGWLYLPAMLLFGTLSCSRALGAVILVNPVLAGLGLFVFFRHEGTGRVAATVGGLTLALAMCGSVVVLSMPFAGGIAWTAVALAGASGCLMAASPASRIRWLALTGFALTQVAGAHLTNGLFMAIGLLALYVLARSIVHVRERRSRPGQAALVALALFGSFPVLGAAALLPRLVLLDRASIGHGYLELSRLTAELSNTPPRPPLATRGASVWWGTSFARGPGGYVGVFALLLVGVALTSKRWRLPSAAFAIAGLLGWLLNLDVVIRQSAIRRVALGSSWGQLWLRDPSRFRYLLIFAFAALAGYGTQAWMELPVVEARTLARRASWFAPPLLLFVAAPILAGSPLAPYAPLAAGLAVAVPVLLLASRGSTAFRLAVPAVAAIDLILVGLVGLTGSRAQVAQASTISTERFGHSFPRLRRPDLPARTYVTPGSIGRVLADARPSHGRYVTFDPERAARQVTQARPANLRIEQAAYEDGQSILFELGDVQGYSPVQLDRYWRLVRRVDRIPLFYSAATFRFLSPEVLRLFGVEWVITHAGRAPPPGGEAVATENGFVLYRLRDAAPRASVVFAWTRTTAEMALDEVLTPGFDPALRAVIETDPGIPVPPPGSPPAPGLVSYEESGLAGVRIRVRAERPALLVVRNPYDRGWQARIDGNRTKVLLADYVMQAVAVPAGSHTVELTYRDPWIGRGLAVSAVAWAILVAAGVWVHVAPRRRRQSAAG